MAKKKTDEPSSWFNYTPIAVLALGASVVAGAALYGERAPRETAIVYPVPIEETTEVTTLDHDSTAEPAKVPVDVPEQAKPVETEIVVEAPAVVVEPVEPVVEEPMTTGVPSPIEWPVVQEKPVEVPVVIVPPLPEKKPMISTEKKKTKCNKKKVQDESVKDIFTKNLLRGNGF